MSTLFVAAWPDPSIDNYGFRPTSLYFTHCWLPVIGPTASWIYQLLNARLAGVEELDWPAQPEGFEVRLSTLLLSVGLVNVATGSHRFEQNLTRLVRFDLARRAGTQSTWAGSKMDVRRRVPWLNDRQLKKVPEHVMAAHLRLMAAHNPEPFDH